MYPIHLLQNISRFSLNITNFSGVGCFSLVELKLYYFIITIYHFGDKNSGNTKAIHNILISLQI